MYLGPPIRPPAEPKPDELLCRLFFFDGGNPITTSHEFFAANDEEALKEVRENAGKAEQWSYGCAPAS
jgi:hypothetical protein